MKSQGPPPGRSASCPSKYGIHSQPPDRQYGESDGCWRLCRLRIRTFRQAVSRRQNMSAYTPSHPLALLNISDHFTRCRLSSASTPMSKTRRDSALTSVIGAILGSQSNRELAIVNTFEIRLLQTDNDIDAETLDADLLESRREQCRTALSSPLMSSSASFSYTGHHWLVLEWRYPYLDTCIHSQASESCCDNRRLIARSRRS